MLPSLNLSEELIVFLAVLGIAIALALLIRYSPTKMPTLEAVFRTDLVVNGVTTTPDGRTFSVFQRQGKAQTPQVGEWMSDSIVRPFPDADWNGWYAGSDAYRTFVHINALRVGPDGALWIVDTGAPTMNINTLPNGPKLVRIDLTTNQVSRIYPLDTVAGGHAYMNDVRFHGRLAYITDSGRPGLVVLDLESGQARRVLDNHPALIAQRPHMANGRELRNPQNEPVTVHADELELSPDGRWLYVESASGPMSKIETQYVDNETLSDAERGRYVHPFADTPSTGGTAMDASGTIYLSDKDHPGIIRITPDGRMSDVVRDIRLDFVDAMWIDDNGDLMAPASQLGRTPAMNGGRNETKSPFTIYRIKLGLKPLRR